MRVNIVGQGGYSSSGLTIDGAILTGPLTLSGNPVSPLEAATKDYVDLAGNSLDASKITTGTLPVGRMPAFTGDLTSATGNNVLTLGTTGVVAGTYTKVTVDVKGRVVSAGNITATDVPNFDWNNITTGKPTTLSGYGITNGVSINGDFVTGYVTAHADPTSGLQLATKQYVDNKAASGGGALAGTTIRRVSTTTPAGYLRCNGALVSKTTYPALYAIFGDNAVSSNGVLPGSGQPWRQQYDFNTTQSGDISGWVKAGPTPLPFFEPTAFVTKNRVYLFGPDYRNEEYVIMAMYSAPINADGSLGAWSVVPSPSVNLLDTQVVVTKNRVYILGGYDGSDAVSTVHTAPINSDGTLGAWSVAGSLPVPFYAFQAVVTSTRVYIFGGGDDSGYPVNAVYTAPVNSDGTLGAWTASTPTPFALNYGHCLVTKNRVYFLGGYDEYSDTVSSCYTAPINTDGTLGTWQLTTPVPTTINKGQVVVTKNSVYIFGGNRGYAISAETQSGELDSVYVAPINTDGTLGTWGTGTNLLDEVSGHQAIVTGSRVYLLGGYDLLFDPSIYYANFSGGMNDYSTFYTTGYVTADPDNFRLPDTTTTDTGGLYTYIKT